MSINGVSVSAAVKTYGGHVICAMPLQRLYSALFLQVCFRAAAALRRKVTLFCFSEAPVLTRYLLGGGSRGESEADEGDIPDIPGLHFRFKHKQLKYTDVRTLDI